MPVVNQFIIKHANKNYKTIVASFYKFIKISEPVKIKIALLELCNKGNILGTILIAPEGLNGTISGNKIAIERVINFLREDNRFVDLTPKISFSNNKTFNRMKVKIKKEIVTMGVDNIEPDKISAKFIDTNHWNELISDPDTILIDTRNHYETSIGTFKGAISPSTDSFRDFPTWVDSLDEKYKKKKIAMFCTGGIRCEKASSMMLKKGFKNVYQLNGGILKYLEEINQNDSLWEGSCFVFDDRVALNHGLEESIYEMCHACRTPFHPDEKMSKYFVEGVSCSKCYNNYSDERKERFAERQKQIGLAKKRNEDHLGKKMRSRNND